MGVRTLGQSQTTDHNRKPQPLIHGGYEVNGLTVHTFLCSLMRKREHRNEEKESDGRLTFRDSPRIAKKVRKPSTVPDSLCVVRIWFMVIHPSLSLCPSVQAPDKDFTITNLQVVQRT